MYTAVVSGLALAIQESDGQDLVIFSGLSQAHVSIMGLVGKQHVYVKYSFSLISSMSLQ
jgi:hypothetical protein